MATAAATVPSLWQARSPGPGTRPPWEQADPEHHAHAAEREGRIVLAGQLAPENVREAIEAVEPWAVDASSRLELSPGIKDHDRIRAFVEAVRS